MCRCLGVTVEHSEGGIGIGMARVEWIIGVDAEVEDAREVGGPWAVALAEPFEKDSRFDGVRSASEGERVAQIINIAGAIERKTAIVVEAGCAGDAAEGHRRKQV